MKRSLVITLIFAMLIFGAASAQDGIMKILLPTGDSIQIFCEGENVQFLVEQQTTAGTVSCIAVLPTPTPTVVVIPPTATPVIPTATVVPPTPTILPPTATPTPKPGKNPRVNISRINAVAGSPLLDANNWSIIAGGSIFEENYLTLRLVDADDGMRMRAQIFDPDQEANDSLSVQLGTFKTTLTFLGNDVTGPDGWVSGTRGERGWTGDLFVDWLNTGGRPSLGSSVPMTITFNDYDNGAQGKIVTLLYDAFFGLPEYNGVRGSAQIITTSLSADAGLGGGTTCGMDDWPDFYPTWGTRNTDSATEMPDDHSRQMGLYYQVNLAQMQWDQADWPCFSKYIAKFQVPVIPVGNRITSAILKMSMFGNPGYQIGGTGTTVMQIAETSPNWTEEGVTWDNAPIPLENISRTPVLPLPNCSPTPYWYCDPPVSYEFDVTEIVKRAREKGQSEASFLIYTSAGQYHSGKFFYARESQAWGPKVYIEHTPIESTPTVTATPVVIAPPTATPIVFLPTVTFTPVPINSTVFYISPSGNDSNSGATLASAWATFGKAWQVLKAGDTLLLADGVYKAGTTGLIRPNVRNGEPGKPITIKALNDGRAIVDGEGKNSPVQLGNFWENNAYFRGDYFTLEGLVLRNGERFVLSIEGSNNVARRVSAYNAGVDGNTTVIWIAIGSGNVVEDCVAGGTGRYMIESYESNNNTIRRCAVFWQRWDGRSFCGIGWPNGYTIGVYNSSNTIVENNIVYGRGVVGNMIQANHDAAIADNNRMLGNITALMGRDYDASPMSYGTGLIQPTVRPGPMTCTGGPIQNFNDGGVRQGFFLFGQGRLVGNVFKDNIAVDNYGIGWSAMQPYDGATKSGNVVDKLTSLGNGLGAEKSWEMAGGGNILIRIPGVSVSNSKIANSSYPQGQGAQIQYRYENGTLTNIPLKPFPMEERTQSEVGVSVNSIIDASVTRATGATVNWPVLTGGTQLPQLAADPDPK